MLSALFDEIRHWAHDPVIIMIGSPHQMMTGEIWGAHLMREVLDNAALTARPRIVVEEPKGGDEWNPE